MLGLEAAFPGRLFALGSKPGASGSASDHLRLRCFGGKLELGGMMIVILGEDSPRYRR